MLTLSLLTNSHRPRKNVQRVGRGVGSKRGKTSCRGVKGDKARSGYKRHYGREGGQLALYRKLPARGFSNGRFRSDVYSINLGDLEAIFNDGDIISLATLQQKGCAPRRAPGGLKILANGNLTKKVTIEAHHISQAAQEKLEKQGISCKLVE